MPTNCWHFRGFINFYFYMLPWWSSFHVTEPNHPNHSAPPPPTPPQGGVVGSLQKFPLNPEVPPSWILCAQSLCMWYWYVKQFNSVDTSIAHETTDSVGWYSSFSSPGTELGKELEKISKTINKQMDYLLIFLSLTKKPNILLWNNNESLEVLKYTSERNNIESSLL